MKNICIIFLIALFAVSSAFAADFAPTLLKISAAPAIQYDFDGSALNIDVKITGTPASTIFLVYTKDKASSIGTINNGYLGWHTVNKIDTCIYAGEPLLLDVGNNVVTWDGNDQDGNAVEKGEYTYYLWGYDAVNVRYLACPIQSPNMSRNADIITRDYQGNPHPRPLVYSNPRAPSDTLIIASSGAESGFRERWKWVLGSDPLDETLYETTLWTCFLNMAAYVPSPYEADMFYDHTTDDNLLARIRKWTWIPNGQSEQDVDWGEDGEFTYAIPASAGWDMQLQGMRYVGGDLLAAGMTSHYGVSTEAELVLVDAVEGGEEFRIDLSTWWVSIEDGEAGGQSSSGPNKMHVIDNNLFLGAHSSCSNQMIVPTAGEDEEDWQRWVNMGGDYTGDHNFEEDSERPWVCHDYNVGPYKYHIKADANLFSVFPSFDMGAVTFGLYAPDGTGLSYHPLAGESAGGKLSTTFVDDDTPYDGMYSDFVSSGGEEAPWGGPDAFFFTAHDSVKGVIASVIVSVDDDAPAAYAVAQNSPNPFNPTTTISFTNTEAGNVSIDVFNVAGQKVDTIASQFMGAGNHSVTWNASEFSAGVYFYTVKSGEFSKTMKMTLLK